MNSKLILSILISLIWFSGHSSNTCGYVFDKETGERLIGVNITNTTTFTGVATNHQGYFCFNPQPGSIWVFSMVGYQSDTLIINSDTPGFLNMELTPITYELQTVEVVQAQTEYNFLKGLKRMNSAALNQIPAMGGERDLVKAISVLPGISMGMEGFSGITIRGGGTDHNLFLLDGVPVYNSGHLFNFLSIYNAEAVNDIAIYKNAFPSKYGGRLASVLDVSLKEGNFNETEFKADLGLITSRLTLEGPLGNAGKTSYMLAARSTYLDLFKNRSLREIRERPLGEIYAPGYVKESDFGYTFSDVSAKITHRANSRNWFFATLYTGFDNYRVYETSYGSKSELNLRRSNMLISLKSHHLVSDNFYLEFIASLNRESNLLKDFIEESSVTTYFDVETNTLTNTIYLENKKHLTNANSILDYSGTAQFSYNMANLGLITGGAGIINHQYQPMDLTQLVEDSIDIIQEINLDNGVFNALEYYLFAGYEKTFFNQLSVDLGVRLSGFLNEGTSYFMPEPRASLGYKLTEQKVLNLSFARMTQYNHALIRNEQIMQNTIWVPSTDRIRPQRSTQLSLSYLHTFSNSGYSFESGIYYKEMDDLVFLDVSLDQIFPFYNWESELLSGGIGQGYGFELSLEKQKGRITGSTNYTYSNHQRQFDEVNRGDWFPYKYNRSHEFNILVSYNTTRNWDLGFYWTISSGVWNNFPNGQVEDNPFGWGYYAYTGINNYRVPTYHRLDLFASWTKELKNEHTLGFEFNIYNAYNRHNSSYMYIDHIRDYDSQGNTTGPGRRVIKSVTFLPIIPTLNISYEL